PWREEKIAEVAHDVLSAAWEVDPVRAGAHGLGDGSLRVELLAHLVEVGGLDVGAEADVPGVGREAAEDGLENGRLAVAIGADEAQAVAAADDEVEVLDDFGFREFLRNARQLGHQPSGALAFVDREAHVADARAPSASLLAQALETAHAAFVA